MSEESEKAEETKGESWQEDYRGRQGVRIVDIDIGFGRIIEIVFKWFFAVAIAMILVGATVYALLAVMGLGVLL